MEHVDPERLLSESHDVIIREIAPFMRRGAYKLQARAIELGLPMPQQVQTLRAGARRASLRARPGRGSAVPLRTGRPDLRLVPPVEG